MSFWFQLGMLWGLLVWLALRLIPIIVIFWIVVRFIRRGDKPSIQIRCQNCGALNPENSAFCNSCSESMGQLKINAVTVKREQTSKIKTKRQKAFESRLLIAVIFIAIIAFGALFVYSQNEQNRIREESQYLGDSDTDLFHKATCPWIKHLDSSNFVRFYSRSSAVSRGYDPCPTCNP